MADQGGARLPVASASREVERGPLSRVTRAGNEVAAVASAFHERGPDLCPNCGAEIPPGGKCRDLFYELSAYTISTGTSVSSTSTSSMRTQRSTRRRIPPIATTAGLIGLYLFAKKGVVGTAGQRAHMSSETA